MDSVTAATFYLSRQLSLNLILCITRRLDNFVEFCRNKICGRKYCRYYDCPICLLKSHHLYDYISNLKNPIGDKLTWDEKEEIIQAMIKDGLSPDDDYTKRLRDRNINNHYRLETIWLDCPVYINLMSILKDRRLSATNTHNVFMKIHKSKKV